MFIVPVNFKSSTIPADINNLLEMATGNKVMKFEGNEGKRLKIKEEEGDNTTHYVNLNLNGIRIGLYEFSKGL
jgi:hypothetical protein